MAGSYSHATTRSGNLRSNESFVGMIENLGDAYEMAEEMYGMIWALAYEAVRYAGSPTPTPEALRATVERARLSYERGLEIAREANRGS
jgi:hypothetical protein